jgi:DNA repair ATPase RecN
MTTNRWRTRAAVAVIAAVAVTGCGSETLEENEAQACEQLGEAQAAVQQVRELDAGSATLDQYRTAIEDVTTNLSAVRDEVGDVAEDRLAAIETSIEGVRSSLTGAGGRPLPEVKDALDASLDELRQSIDAANEALGCS